MVWGICRASGYGCNEVLFDPWVKYSLRYLGSKKNLFPAAQPEPETEMPKIMVYSREVNNFYIVYKFRRYRMPIDGAKRCQIFRRIPQYGLFGKIAETVNFDLKNG